MTYALAEELLRFAEEIAESKDSESQLLELLNQAQSVDPDNAFILCRCARILYRYGILNSKGRYILLALDKIKSAEEKNPHFFDKSTVWCQLWGNILVQLGKILEDFSFFECALEKYQRASRALICHDSTLYWDWGKTWMLLGKESGEVTDFQQGLAKFHLAKKENVRSYFFDLDYSDALLNYGKLIGEPSFLEEALCLLSHVISDSLFTNKEATVAYVVAWRKLALTKKARYQLTHIQQHLNEADVSFREAILANTKNGELWLDWGELFLDAGWVTRDFKLIETGLEKLTASKVKECNPIRVSLLLGKGLILFGLILENLKLITDGKERIQSAALLTHDQAQFLYTSGLAEFGLALYFSNQTLYALAAHAFEKGTHEWAGSAENWHALFQTYLAWGLKLQDSGLVKKGISTIARLCELRPFSYVFFYEWGLALLRLQQLVSNVDLAVAYVEEALLKFQRSYELNESDDTLYHWGCALDLLGDLTADEEYYIKSIDLLIQAFEKKPADLHIRYHLGLAYSHLGELTLNLDCLKTAIDLLDGVAKFDQENEQVWCELGYALLILSEDMRDVYHPEEANRLNRECEKALLRAAKLGSGYACYLLACLYSLSGYYEASIDYLKRAEKSDELPSIEDLNHNDWLANIRATKAFRDFLMTWKKDG